MPHVLYLPVHSAFEIKQTVFIIPDIARLIDKLAVAFVKRILYKALSGFFGIIIIPERKARAEYANLAVLAVFGFSSVLCEKQNLIVLIWLPYRENRVFVCFFGNLVISAGGGSFRRAVLIYKKRVGQSVLPGTQGFARNDRARKA